MFLHVCVCPQEGMHGKGTYMAGGIYGTGGLHATADTTGYHQ